MKHLVEFVTQHSFTEYSADASDLCAYDPAFGRGWPHSLGEFARSSKAIDEDGDILFVRYVHRDHPEISIKVFND